MHDAYVLQLGKTYVARGMLYRADVVYTEEDVASELNQKNDQGVPFFKKTQATVTPVKTEESNPVEAVRKSVIIGKKPKVEVVLEEEKKEDAVPI